MDLLASVKVISTPSSGVNHIDMKALTARGIRVGHSPGHCPSDSVTDFAFGLILASARSIIDADRLAKSSDVESLHFQVRSKQIGPQCVHIWDDLNMIVLVINKKKLVNF